MVCGEDETNSMNANSEWRREMGCDRERDRTMLRQIASNNRSNEERTELNNITANHGKKGEGEMATDNQMGC